ncbi:MAG: serine/threonine-protein kinase [Gammaproteobacteria bacterium]|nr:serine/threonine-protein kinase [Gammaproteobacteria bacterium]HJP05623.1 serine/threonine-protein kinase [Gammaproteobacteria bacterium]
MYSRPSSLWPAAALILIALLVGTISQINGLETWVYDFFQRYQYKAASDKIVLVTVDSRAEQYKDVWSGSRFSQLASLFNDYGAKLVVATQPLTIMDAKAESQILALAKLQKLADSVESVSGEFVPLVGQIEELQRNYDARNDFIGQMAKSGNILLSGYFTNINIEGSSSANCANHAVNLKGTEPESMRNSRRIRHISVPPEDVCKAVRAIGFTNYWPDPDGITRWAELVVNADGIYLPSLALATKSAMQGNNDGIVIAAPNAVYLQDKITYTDNGFRLLNRYYNGTLENPAFQKVTLSSVRSGQVDQAIFRDRIVLIGESDLASMPGLATPVNANMSPLEVTASTLSNLIESDFLLRPEWLSNLEIGTLLAIWFLILLWMPNMPTIGAALTGLVLATLLLMIEAWFLISEGIWVQFASAGVFAAIAVWTMHVWNMATIHQARTIQRPVRPISTITTDKQGQLDLEFSVLRQQAPTDDTKEQLYEIAQMHGQARKFARAEQVLKHIAKLDPNYRDVAQLLEKLSGARKKKAPARRKTSATSGSLNRRKLGRYEIDRVVGRGAMATVYLGRDPAINRKVAIKTVALAREFDEGALRDARLQFQREAESAGRLNHPNIITIYDTGEDDDVSYLAMEFFEGMSLLEHSQPDDLLPAKRVLELGARAAEALYYAHKQKVVHRDIKPANVLYHAATDTLKLTDFGIARLTDSSWTKTGIILGTPSYMPPEQLSGDGVTGQSDLYSLGVTLYQLLTGSVPFRADSIPELMDKIINEDPIPVCQLRKDVPECMDEIINKALAKDPGDRFTTGHEMAVALRDCAKNFS